MVLITVEAITTDTGGRVAIGQPAKHAAICEPRDQSVSASSSVVCYEAVLDRERPDKKKAGPKARQKVRSDKEVKTFQRERPAQRRREEESDAALRSATAHIDRILPLCNPACLMKGLQITHASLRHPAKRM
jgi:hypothetical protein